MHLPSVVVMTSLQPTESSRAWLRRHPVNLPMGTVPMALSSWLPCCRLLLFLIFMVMSLCSFPKVPRGIGLPPSGPPALPCATGCQGGLVERQLCQSPNGTLAWIPCEVRTMPCPQGQKGAAGAPIRRASSSFSACLPSPQSSSGKLSLLPELATLTLKTNIVFCLSMPSVSPWHVFRASQPHSPAGLSAQRGDHLGGAAFPATSLSMALSPGARCPTEC